MVVIGGYPGVTDRMAQGPRRPWGSEGRHARRFPEPAQLPGPLHRASPYLARLGGPDHPPARSAGHRRCAAQRRGGAGRGGSRGGPTRGHRARGHWQRPLPDTQTADLVAVLARRRQVVKMHTAEQNRLTRATGARVRHPTRGAADAAARHIHRREPARGWRGELAPVRGEGRRRPLPCASARGRDRANTLWGPRTGEG